MVTVKGTKMTPPGLQDTVIPPDYMSLTVPLMEAEAASGGWNSDALLQAVLANPNDGFIGSHTLTHLSRDELQVSDCNAEDGANVRIAVYSGMFDMDTYNWRSMVSPGITGLFNANCLMSGEANLMTCYPGDNTHPVLVNQDNEYHSIYSTVATNGHAGMQIVPRYATFVYYNCVTGQCLVDENEYIRRLTCNCSEPDPTIPDRGTCLNVGSEYGCNSNDDIASFGSIDAIYKAEAETTTRYMLMGRRDKYMFHQANIIPAADLGGMSALEKWYVDVMATLSSFITFPVKSVKFDDLCANFQEHEALDADSPTVTATKDAATGSILGMSLDSTGGAGVIPVTVPTADAASVLLGSLTPYKTETYGSDTTYYFTSGTPPSPAPKPTVSDLPPLTAAAAGDFEHIPLEEQEEAALEGIDAEQENAAVAAEKGFVAPDQPLLGPEGIKRLKEQAIARIYGNFTDPVF
ncbi:unnamed protein product [Sphacelaria rigidula]